MEIGPSARLLDVLISMAPISTGSGPLLHSLGCGGHAIVSYIDRRRVRRLPVHPVREREREEAMMQTSVVSNPSSCTEAASSSAAAAFLPFRPLRFKVCLRYSFLPSFLV